MKRLLCALLAVGLLGAAPARKPKRRSVPKPPRVSAKVRAESQKAVDAYLHDAAYAGIQNPEALLPFYESLRGLGPESQEPVRVLHFGDSHTASDDWPGAIRARFQTRFGDGGPGFVHAGRPFKGWRRFDAKATATRNWQPRGLLNGNGDGLYGLAGVRIETTRRNERITLAAAGARVELWYWQQPGGATLRLNDGSADLGELPTDGPPQPGFAVLETQGSEHAFTAETTGGPAWLFGWVLENRGGVTWETLGINGAHVDLQLNWDEKLFATHVQRRNPALIVLAYGTNEAGQKAWTYESYREAFAQVIARLRAAAPAASILVISPADRLQRVKGKWIPHPGLEHIAAAQHDAAVAARCAYWNLRAAMGGTGSMKQWVQAGLAQGDFVHFNAAGYRLLGEALYELLAAQYDVYLTARKQAEGTTEHGPARKDP